MKAMVLNAAGSPLVAEMRPDPVPAPGELRIRVEACAICRTDLHVVDGELPDLQCPRVPGHEVVGRIDLVGAGAAPELIGRRVGLGWLGHACGHCPYCRALRENLCDSPAFTGYTRDGGFANHVIAHATYVFPLDEFSDPVAAAPLMCAGLIGWRSLRSAGAARRIGLYGFGVAAHILAQICHWQGREVYAFTRPDDEAAQAHARSLGACWAGSSAEKPPVALDAALIFAPVGTLIPLALSAVVKGGRVVCGGIHMSDIPSFGYDLLWHERELVSVANLTRADGHEFLAVARQAGIATKTAVYRLEQANEALSDLRAGRLQGAAVLVP
ncbi:MAG: zinc-dependent alcohol dehydrogenase family protein [Bosea sp.]|uniref:zinc-dependent alcohol dehydrogenase family protein n=1 Tax=Bosea sp. (in: a-proteobacteria) TaxID=1871050 RepID=UPI001ACB80EA|nr:zinc-dependent alcohol dehydrogenase family protein [Bosea sp. (in: a-proteobacteria)]MBN9453362.1 zinc-dependent alcohol dehydrogenase family protein [Bosea sp. (in: a-proteobacteria)]